MPAVGSGTVVDAIIAARNHPRVTRQAQETTRIDAWPRTPRERRLGRAYVGTSGFSYPGWVPKFYAPGKASRKLLAAYATRLPAVELHNTFMRRPNEQQIEKWMRETGPDFRFCPKAQRSTSWRAFAEPDPTESIRWLTDALEGFGERLGSVLLSLRGSLERDDEALERALSAWPAAVPLALELLHPSWHAKAVDERAPGAWRDPGGDRPRRPSTSPSCHEGGGFTYLRLRRETCSTHDIERWATRLEPLLASGTDAFVFFRHDDDGQMALHAETMLARLSAFTGP